MKQKIETRVADAVLERLSEITVGNTTYQVAPPSTATLILVSEEIAKMPEVKLSYDNILTETLGIARECRPIGDIIAIMILGAKGLQETVIVAKKRLFGLVIEEQEVVINKKEVLARQLLEDITPNELLKLSRELLKGLQVSDFFGLTTFLTEINLLKATRKVGETTAYGQ